MVNARDGVLGLLGLVIVFAIGCAGSHMTRTPAQRALWAAAESGNPEAQRRVAHELMPDATSRAGGDAGHAAFWFQTACEQHYANAQVDFYEFAETYRLHTGDGQYLDQALACLNDAINQGHRRAIIAGASRAETREKNYERAFFLYSLRDEEDPEWADQRWNLVDHLPAGAPERIDRRAANWRASHTIRDHDDFLIEQSASQ